MTRIHDKIGCGVSTSLCDAGGVASCSESELDLTGNHFGMPLISSPEIMSDCNRAVRKPRKSKLTSTNQPDLETWFRVRLGALSRRDRITGQVARDSADYLKQEVPSSQNCLVSIKCVPLTRILSVLLSLREDI